MQALAELSTRIAVLEREINVLARTKYPQTLWLQQVPGVGVLTALYFVLKIEDPQRFENVRDVGAYAGLGPFGPQSALRAYGLMLAADGSARARKQAVVAVARKLAVLLLSLWKNRRHYEAFPHWQTIEDKRSGTIAMHRVEG